MSMITLAVEIKALSDVSYSHVIPRIVPEQCGLIKGKSIGTNLVDSFI